MIAETKAQAKTLIKGLPSPRPYPDSKDILMVSPDHYRIEYAINPFMKDENGNLKTVDAAKARDEWQRLKWVYEDIGLTVTVLPGEASLPDMVFAANPAFPFFDRETGQKCVLMARMRDPRRQGEVPFYKHWFTANGYRVFELESPKYTFEGNGDALVHPKLPLVWGAYGPRTDRAAYEEITRRFGLEVILLKIQREEFYHLDTCFSILSPKTVALVPSAFSKESLAIIHQVFDEVIAIDETEAIQNFAGNCFCPDRRDVLLQKGSPKLLKLLDKAGFEAHEVETGEFIKAGGSVFCLKMQLL